jgi:hypothetical protein
VVLLQDAVRSSGQVGAGSWELDVASLSVCGFFCEMEGRGTDDEDLVGDDDLVFGTGC